MTSQITEDKQEGYHPPAWGEDAVSRRIMDLTGVKLDIRHQGYGTAVDVEALIAAGEITDLICTFSAGRPLSWRMKAFAALWTSWQRPIALNFSRAWTSCSS